jgi:hypothetical protein
MQLTGPGGTRLNLLVLRVGCPAVSDSVKFCLARCVCQLTHTTQQDSFLATKSLVWPRVQGRQQL